MSVSLLAAFAVSLCLHVAVLLLVPGIEQTPEPGALPPPLLAELRPALPEPPPPPRSLLPEAFPPPEPAPRAAAEAPGKAPVAAKRPPTRKTVAATAPAPSAPSGPSLPMATPALTNGAAPPVETETHELAAPADPPGRLPPRGRIGFRVDRGDSGFEIGRARQEWEFEAGRYRLVSSVETTGLAWLIRAVDIDMESIGQISAGGLRPEAFGVMRSGRKARERALFDWESMKVRVSDDSDHTLDPGAQDMLSFYYQLGFLDIPTGRTGWMPLATGKKYGVYALENLGDESIEIPLGVLDTRHLRTPGENATEIWLAYDYRLLPVKIRHVDNKGNAYVQVATEILFGE